MSTLAMTTPSVPPLSSGTALGELERYSESHDDPTTALREAVEALWTIAGQAARDGAFEEAPASSGGASFRVELVHRGQRILSGIIRRGVASGAFRPRCAQWAEQGLAHALIAGACARWVLGLPEERSLRAGPAAEAALEALRPTRRPRSPKQIDRNAGRREHEWSAGLRITEYQQLGRRPGSTG